ncbi:LacI family transcriptional regulator [Ktedonosporobacter rubrisoli]|uniref:LacI family transcriptional regulator n=1 Tax=Ktedonosporobacter rubrisoli TaxID=2509675 RepID=A0A4P6K0L1_KTERU|nr:LacI family DNA-binding transcriptional regulator [Ktedonosporobacter rubrisoli]QBD81589.1 LacI family transcriptional regulator [Ktedonosporobacter rubrisoli]
MANIQDVAKHAGVSIATVSRVLNGTARVNAEVSARVHAAIEELQYQPSRAARALRANRSTIIGLLISDIQNPFFTTLIRGVEDVAQRNGYSLILCNSDEDPQKEQHYIEVLSAERVAGVIIVPIRENQRTLRLFREREIPVVSVDRRIKDSATDAILVDNKRGAHEAITHLITNGYRRIAIITGPMTTTTGRERLEGYRQALQDAGIAYDPALELCGTFKDDSGRQLAIELLGLQSPIDALFVCNNLMMMGVLDALTARHLRIPDDIAIVGFDEMPWAALSTISLTTVTQPVYELGSTAAMRLFQRMQHPGTFTRQEIVLAPTLQIRSSSRPRMHPASTTVNLTSR